MEKIELLVTVLVCFSGSGGIVLWALNRIAKKRDDREELIKEMQLINSTLNQLKGALVLALENDKIIFRALRKHEINGDSEKQEKKMDDYFISMLDKKEKSK